LPRDTATMAALDSPGSCPFNNGICEAQCSALGGSPTVSLRFMRLNFSDVKREYEGLRPQVEKLFLRWGLILTFPILVFSKHSWTFLAHMP
jgi:hypothetical protein